MNPAEISDLADSIAVIQPKRPPRSWSLKFLDAFRGWKAGIRGHSSFFAHFFFASLVILAAFVLKCSLNEWCLLLLCISGVFVSELFNSALETLFRELPIEIRDRSYRCLDIAAGAVLMASLFSVIIGMLIFGSRLLLMLG